MARSRSGTSVVPAGRPAGEPVYRRELTTAGIRHRIRLAHEPFHGALDAAIENPVFW